MITSPWSSYELQWAEWRADKVDTGFNLPTTDTLNSRKYDPGTWEKQYPNPIRSVTTSLSIPVFDNSNWFATEWDPRNVPPGDIGKMRFYTNQGGLFNSQSYIDMNFTTIY
jgi:hypothetical protein